jgi:ATP-dependent Clp protease ATP-binding subunit ClpB
VYVGEPSVEDTIAILRGLKERYEVHHGVRIQDAAGVSGVLSDRYLTGRFLPDKAIDSWTRRPAGCASRSTDADGPIDRRARMRQLEIERAALAKETDDAPKERREALDAELAGLKAQTDDMKAHWEAREAIGAIRP